jgi:hypothetical protein
MNALFGTALVVGVFFVIGVIVGIISVIAMAAIRSDRDQKPPTPPPWSDPDEGRLSSRDAV